jgi:hypothetical protein
MVNSTNYEALHYVFFSMLLLITSCFVDPNEDIFMSSGQNKSLHDSKKGENIIPILDLMIFMR